MKIINLLFCDDIRQEIGNKATLVGCYNDRVLLNPNMPLQWPISLKLGLYIRIDREPSEKPLKTFKVEIRDSSEVLNTFGGPIVANQNKADATTILGIVTQFKFVRPGKILTVITVEDTDGKFTEFRPEQRLSIEVAGQVPSDFL